MTKTAAPATVGALVAAAAVNSRSVSEALGKAGLEQAKSRLGHTTDPRYIDRYHGPDDMTHSSDGKLTEWEAKGTNSDNTTVATDVDGYRQGSRGKNAKRANMMLVNKSPKIDMPSNRQGGSYTKDEIDLWEDVSDRDGYKQHISVHTNTETGRVRVFERDHKGTNPKTLADFKMDHFEEIKQGLKELI